MSGKGPEEMAVITSTVNAQVDTFVFNQSESMFGDAELIFSRMIMHISAEQRVQTDQQSRSRSDWKFMVEIEKEGHKAPSCQADLSTAAQECWNLIDEEYWFSWVNVS